MTCFRMKNGMTLLKACKAASLCYHNVYTRLEKGMQPDEAFWEALKNKGNKRSHAKYFYNGKPLTVVLNHNMKKYHNILDRTRRGMPLIKSIEYELAKIHA